MLQASSSSRGRDIGAGLIALAAVAGALVLGQLATFPNLPWYAELAKPSFKPPNWLFGPVWTALYALMAFAAWRVMRLRAEVPGRTFALALFFIQLALNAAWSWMFFWAHNPALGLLNIVPQLLFVVAAAVALYRIDRLAGACLVPLIAWVGFAAILNFSIWRLNG
jgi:benzodiazapine receptor